MYNGKAFLPDSTTTVLGLTMPCIQSLLSSPSTAWELALETHLVGLSPAQRAAFQTPTSAEDCIAAVRGAQNGRKRVGFTKVLETLRPLIEPLKRFEGAVDVLVQTNGIFCSPIWGPIRIVITLAGDHLKSVEKLTKILERVVGLLPRAQTYEELFKSNETAKRAIGTLYTDFIDFCTRAVKYHSLPYHRFIRHDFNKEFDDVWEKIQYDSQQMDWVANATSLRANRSFRETENNRYNDEQRMALQRWLSPSNIRDDLLRCRRQLMPLSCDPLLRSSEFEEWVARPESSLLRVGGHPGAGKTHFATAAYDRLEQSGELTVYFFCKSGSKDRATSLNVLRTLLSQILKLHKSAYDIIIPLYQENGREKADSISEIEHMFSQVLEGLPVLYVVIDALDELSDRAQLFEALESFLSQYPSVIKILVTGRNETDIVKSFEKHPCLQMTSEMTRSPIEVYIDQRLSDCSTLANANLKRAISKKVNDEVNGLWLYAKLMVDAVTESPTTSAIERQLRRLPHGLSETYFELLERHADRLTPWQIEWAQQLFLWVDTEDYNWLLSKGEKWSIDESILSVIFQAVNGDGDSPLDPLSIAKLLGGPMMELSWSEEEVTRGIDYIHLSAKQYIMSASDCKGHQLPRLLKARRLRQLLRGSTALWYFGSSTAGRDNLQLYRDNPENSCEEWWETPHPIVVYGLWDAMTLTRLPDDMDHEEIAMAHNLCNRLVRFLATDECLIWVESAIIVNYAGQWANLLGNAQKVLVAVGTSPVSKYPFFERFLQARWDFFSYFAHVLATTGPRDLFDDVENYEGIIPLLRSRLAFSNPLPVHKKVMAVGRRYEYLVDKICRKCGKQFLIGGNSE